jgi:Ca2+-binding EF-hand superfamily protein
VLSLVSGLSSTQEELAML